MLEFRIVFSLQTYSKSFLKMHDIILDIYDILSFLRPKLTIT